MNTYDRTGEVESGEVHFQLNATDRLGFALEKKLGKSMVTTNGSPNESEGGKHSKKQRQSVGTDNQE